MASCAMLANLLMVDDSEDDIILVLHAIRTIGWSAELRQVHDGQQAIAYLSGRPPFNNRKGHPFPDAMLLDIKMPGKSGFEALEYMKTNPEHKVVPTIVFSSSFYEADIVNAYRLGAHAFFEKPHQLGDLVYVLNTMRAYWELSKRPLQTAIETHKEPAVKGKLK